MMRCRYCLVLAFWGLATELSLAKSFSTRSPILKCAKKTGPAKPSESNPLPIEVRAKLTSPSVSLSHISHRVPTIQKRFTFVTFPITVVVANSSSQVVEWAEQSCGWVNQWKTDSTDVVVLPSACEKNIETSVSLKPGETLTRQLDLSLQERKLGNFSFRLIFSPAGKLKYRSPRLHLAVTP
jgi:hypothetical protein